MKGLGLGGEGKEGEVVQEMERLEGLLHEGNFGRWRWNPRVSPEALRRVLEGMGSIEGEKLVVSMPRTFGREGAAALFGSMPVGAIRVQYLDLSGSAVSDSGAEALARELGANTTITDVSVGGNSITEAGARALAGALRDNANLLRLDLCGNDIGDGGAVAFAEALAANDTLERLGIGTVLGAAFGDDATQAVVRAVAAHRSLTGLSLCGAEHTALAELPTATPRLRRLALRGSLRDEGAALAFVARIGRLATSLTHLDVTRSALGDEGAAGLAAVLTAESCALVRVDAIDCSIGAAGAAALAGALLVNRSLTSLDLSKNDDVENEGARAVFEALKVNHTLTFVSLMDCDVEKLAALAEALRVNRALTWLDLSENSVWDDGIDELADALAANTVLTTLHVKFTNLDSATVQAVDKSLARNRRLREEAVAQRDFLRSKAGFDAVPWIAPDVLVSVVCEYTGRAWSEAELVLHRRSGSHFLWRGGFESVDDYDVTDW